MNSRRGWLVTGQMWVLAIACSGPSADPKPGVGSEGGIVSLGDGASLELPAGAVSGGLRVETKVVSTKVAKPPAGLELAGSVYAFTPHGTVFAEPAHLRIPEHNGGTLYTLDNEQDTTWAPVEGVKIKAHVFEANVSHISLFAELAPTSTGGAAGAGGRDAEEAGSGGVGDAGGAPPSGGVGGADAIGDAGSSGAGEGDTCSEQMCDPEPTQIVAGGNYYCALFANHVVKCWGVDIPGFQGDAYRPSPAVALVVNVTTTPSVWVSSLAAGYHHICALLSDGTVKCWGLTGRGNLGYGQEPPTDTDLPPSSVGTVNVTSDPDLKVTQVITARTRTCVLLSDGTVKCWGESPLGALGYGIEYGGRGYGSAFGIGDDETPSIMGAVSITSTPSVKVTQIVGGEYHNCALLSDGTVKCWGYPNWLGYGDGVWVGRDVLPSSVGSVSITTKPGVVATQLVAGATFTCALLSDASVHCWGTSEDGQLGLGDTETIGDDELPSSVPPVNVTDAPGVTVTKLFTGGSNSEGGQYVCARLSDLSLKCWGAGVQGMLGYGNEDNIGDDELPSAVGVVSVSTVPGVTVAQMAGSTCALLSNNMLQCWGAWDPQCAGSALPCSPSLPSALPSVPLW